MERSDQNDSDRYSHYLLSTKLEELESITNNLYDELQDSKEVMVEICTLMDSIPMQQGDRPQQSGGLRPEDISQFLAAATSKLLLPNMSENTVDVDLDKMITEMREYAINVKKNVSRSQSQQEFTQRSSQNLDWEQYAVSFDKFAKRLANIKLIKSGRDNRNIVLEVKMGELFKDVNMFTQMVLAQQTLGENNKNWTLTEQDNKVLLYEDLINKILLSTNELSYLLKK